MSFELVLRSLPLPSPSRIPGLSFFQPQRPLFASPLPPPSPSLPISQPLSSPFFGKSKKSIPLEASTPRFNSPRNVQLQLQSQDVRPHHRRRRCSRMVSPLLSPSIAPFVPFSTELIPMSLSLVRSRTRLEWPADEFWLWNETCRLQIESWVNSFNREDVLPSELSVWGTVSRESMRLL